MTEPIGDNLPARGMPMKERCKAEFKGLKCIRLEGHIGRHADRYDVSAVHWNDSDCFVPQADVDKLVADKVAEGIARTWLCGYAMVSEAFEHGVCKEELRIAYRNQMKLAGVPITPPADPQRGKK